MILKIMTFFLIGMMVLAMFGKLKVPKIKGLGKLTSKKCPKCGSFRIGKGPCLCKDRRS
jgi:hypothetical protein